MLSKWKSFGGVTTRFMEKVDNFINSMDAIAELFTL